MQQKYFQISPLMIFPQTLGKFSVYLKQGNDYVLYASRDETFTEKHKQMLHANGVKHVYAKAEHRADFQQYVEDNLGTILNDDSIPAKERSKVLYRASSSLMEETFSKKLPEALGKEHFQRVGGFVRKSARFLANEKSLKTMAQFISHDYKTFTHCVNVFIYAMTIMSTYDLDEKEAFNCGMGAILHDLGKARISKNILNKPGKLTDEERAEVNNHSLYGVALSTHADLDRTAFNCILFHHEKLDGTGYPAKLEGTDIPLPVRVVTVADIYDAITSHRPYAAGVSPFQALRIMRDDMGAGLDKDVMKRFIVVLSGAELIS